MPANVSSLDVDAPRGQGLGFGLGLARPSQCRMAHASSTPSCQCPCAASRARCARVCWYRVTRLEWWTCGVDCPPFALLPALHHPLASKPHLLAPGPSPATPCTHAHIHPSSRQGADVVAPCATGTKGVTRHAKSIGHTSCAQLLMPGRQHSLRTHTHFFHSSRSARQCKHTSTHDTLAGYRLDSRRNKLQAIKIKWCKAKVACGHLPILVAPMLQRRHGPARQLSASLMIAAAAGAPAAATAAAPVPHAHI